MICAACQGENDDAAEVCFHCRHVLVPISRGAVLSGRYEIRSVLGRGGMGMVYEAHDLVLDETVAIKLLRAEFARDPEVAGRFRAEIKLARKVSHRNVCRIHEYGEDQGFGFISMEYVDGGDFKALVQKDGGLPAAEAFDVALQVAEGLEAIHDAHVVHRDLKTVNIVRTSGGVVKVMDFGIAKGTGPDATTGATATGQILGTPEYMSPEQGRGEKADFRSDVYALGVVTFELFTGRVPFRGDSPVATMLMHAQEAPPLEAPFAGRIPAPLVPVLRKAMAKDPRDRYASASEIAHAFREARHAWSSGAEAIPDRTTLRSRARRGDSRSSIALLAVAVVTAIVVVVLAINAPPRGKQTLSGPVAVIEHRATAPPASPSAATPEPGVPRTTPAAATVLRTPSARATTLRAATLPPIVAAASETAVPTPIPTEAPTAAPTLAPTVAAPAAETGVLQIVAVPFADVTIDDAPVGRVSSTRFPLAAGAHVIVLSHPDYRPVRRKLTVLAGATEKLVVDLAEEAIPRKK